FLFDNSKASSKDVPLEEMIEEIESTGHRVVTEKEYIAYTINREEKEEAKEDSAKDKKESSDKKEEKKKDDNKDNEKKDKKDKEVKATITTNDGVVTQDIADKLVDENIINEKEKQEFLDYLDDNDYSPYIQIGKFKVDSDMSMKELAEAFTTYPGD